MCLGNRTLACRGWSHVISIAVSLTMVFSKSSVRLIMRTLLEQILQVSLLKMPFLTPRECGRVVQRKLRTLLRFPLWNPV